MSFDLHYIIFQVFPYIAISFLFLGSILRFDRDPYSWRSKSSQLLRKRGVVLGSAMFHVGILFLLLGHFVGLLTPSSVYHAMGLTTEVKQLIAMISGGLFGVICFIGMTILVWRRLFDPRIRVNSSFADIAILLLLYAQLILGLISIAFSAQHMDGHVMSELAHWAQSIVYFKGGAHEYIRGVDLIFKLHIALGMFIFMIFPFTRLVHFWSAPVGYITRRQYQIVRRREM